MKLVKLSLESKGIYVNHKPTAATQFVEEFDGVEDIEVIVELQKLWVEWHQANPTFKEALELMERLAKVAKRMDEKMG